MTHQSEISALLSLIEDPDESIYLQVKDKLISFGIDVVPDLENAWDHNRFGNDYQLKIENIIHEIQFKDVLNGLQEWKNKGAKDLIEGVILVNKYKFPELDENKIYQKLNSMTQDAKISVGLMDTSLEKVFKLNNVIFQVHGFSGNRSNYYADSNSYLSESLTNHKGNALMLSIIYLEIATRLQIPIKGINLPNHFVLGYEDLNNVNQEFGDQQRFLFYINPFSGGEVVYKNDIDNFLERLNLEKNDKYFAACSNIDIIKRILTNLHYSYKKSDEQRRIEEIQVLLSIFK